MTIASRVFRTNKGSKTRSEPAPVQTQAQAPPPPGADDSYFWGLRPGRPTTQARPPGWHASGPDGSGIEDYWDGRSWTARRQLVDGGWAVVPMNATAPAPVSPAKRPAAGGFDFPLPSAPPTGDPLPADAPPVAVSPVQPVSVPPGVEVPRGFPGASAPSRLAPGEARSYGVLAGQPASSSMGRPVGWYPSGGHGSGVEDYWDGRSWTKRRQQVDGAWTSVPMG